MEVLTERPLQGAGLPKPCRRYRGIRQRFRPTKGCMRPVHRRVYALACGEGCTDCSTPLADELAAR